ncbi:MFS transporter [Streptomyces sp. NPDC001231]|uniref:MFS transporter n=1 Tax=Streptomyces sp. NPDC001231 TaxID=3364549 RepID=UPI00367DC059
MNDLSTSNVSTTTEQAHPTADRLTWGALLVMACTTFVVIMTETLPAGLPSGLASGLRISQGTAGQLVSVYALGTVLAAIPATAMTRGLRRKPVLIGGLAGFLVTNTVTALAPSLAVALVARLLAGAFAGLLWSMLAGYARRIVPERFAGRALAVAMAGTPIALAVGTPVGSWLGSVTDWRWAFGVMSALSVVTIVWALLVVPDAPGQERQARKPLLKVAAIPGVVPILVTVVTWMFAHNVLYTYVGPYLHGFGISLDVDLALLIFGIASLLGLVITATVVDRALRRITLGALALFLAAAVLLGTGAVSGVPAVVGLVLWGLGFGGAATQMQTALAEAAGPDTDVAVSVFTVAFNLAIAIGGVIGGVLVEGAGATGLPVAMGAAALVPFGAVLLSRRTAFPTGR